jgi:beta-1,4-mannosyltransferase
MISPSIQEGSVRDNLIAIYPFVETNPYQTLLSDALEKLGYSILKLPRIDSRFPLQLLSQCRDASVVHFHWIEHLYRARIRLFSPVRTVVFLAILVVLRSRGTRIVFTLHNLAPHDAKWQWLHLLVQDLIIKLSNATIVHSRPALDVACKRFGSRRKFQVISHGRYDGFYPNRVSRTEARSLLNVPNNSRVALFLGGMGGYKGVRHLLESTEELARRNIILLLAGDTSGLGKSDRDLLRQASGNSVILHEGFVPESQVQYFMKSANCLVLPYLDSFTSGMAFLGLSFRLPIVGTSATAFKEIIDLQLGLPCVPNDPKSVAEAIEDVCSWDRTQFKARCDDFLSTCLWDDIAEQHLAVYGFRTSRPATQSGTQEFRDLVVPRSSSDD